jgi:hypothetical protein
MREEQSTWKGKRKRGQETHQGWEEEREHFQPIAAGTPELEENLSNHSASSGQVPAKCQCCVIVWWYRRGQTRPGGSSLLQNNHQWNKTLLVTTKEAYDRTWIKKIVWLKRNYKNKCSFYSVLSIYCDPFVLGIEQKLSQILGCWPYKGRCKQETIDSFMVISIMEK